MKKTIVLLLAYIVVATTFAQTNITIHAEDASYLIPAEIYGQFAEHLGTCIYGGIWVGEESAIPNTNGYRNDVLQALKELQIPVLRWPGGCFADYYHWQDGIGPQVGRAKIVNTYWGGTVEDNSFGTHEFLNLCEMLDIEPYVSMNVGSGTVRETAEWVEYMTSDDDSPMANLRRKNGREKPWKVKYIGIGNESWGCGGQMRPEYYSDLYRRYSEYCKSYSGNRLFKVASGASDYDYNWTEVLMKQIGQRMNALSLHYYTVLTWDGPKGSSTDFGEDNYYWTLGKCLGIEPVLQKHIGIMDQYDPDKRIRLFVDEWGTWWDEEPGTIRGHLFQQNTMRDAMVAALSLNTFHRYADRIGMANIAQMVNVLQAMILTKEDKMVLTPTYHVFKMYKVHQNAVFVPIEIETRQLMLAEGVCAAVPKISATASKDNEGKMHITIVNTSLDEKENVNINIDGYYAKKISADILTSRHVQDHNTFDNPGLVQTAKFSGITMRRRTLSATIPPLSVITIELQ